MPVTVIDGQTVVGFDKPRLEWLLAQAQAQTQNAPPPKFGAAVADVGQAGRPGVPINFGAYVGRIRPGTLAEKAGLAVGDVIVQLNNQAVAHASDLEHILADIKPGDRLTLVFLRGNAVITAEAAA